ncbi:tryptophan synthase subunit alpha [Tumebacillus algifaecis]|uniref:Tryptophan synthase alpha chain n=1 Tax=Tumebacillus algifaecis TaxID=1214604 RepID=A0A223D1K0_9BACL|nr:tryptophan synthase subunit alpha [Tumebacillus algifaecis]ASS75431.1 tryptophan synthase subunit alpha [Tumebacillus algifaecis]
MTRIADTFRRLQETGEKAFMPFLTAGDPNLAITEEVIVELDKIGADIIEIGIPYSDPLADGPTIQAGSLRSLSSGTRMPDVFELVRRVRPKVRASLVLFTYANPVFQWGVHDFFQTAKEVGANGVIIPDLPLEESEEALAAGLATGVDLIPLVAPTSQERIAKIVAQGQGFIYCVAALGVTGVRENLDADLSSYVASVKKHTALPVAVGFGVGKPEHAAIIGQFADGVVVGSAIVKKTAAIADALQAGDAALVEATKQDLVQFAASLKAPLYPNKQEA